MASLELARRSYPAKRQLISEDDLKETQRLLFNQKFSQLRTASPYEAWVEQRKKSIEVIGRLEKRLEDLHRGCNAAHGVGEAMEVVGGVAMIAGAILTACGHKTIGEFLTKKFSPATSVTGMATAMSSSMAEIGLTHATLREVKMVLEKDEVCTKKLEENFRHSKKIDSLLRRIFNCSVFSKSFRDVVRLVRMGILMLEFGSVRYTELMNELKCKAQKCTHTSELIDTVIQNVSTTMKTLSTDPKLRGAVWNICRIIQQSPSAVEFVKNGLRISFQVCDILKVDIITSLLGFGLIKTSAGIMATKGLLGTAMIAINVLSVISAVKDAQEGTSKYAKMLKDLNSALVEELNTVRNNYSKLNCNIVR